MPGNRKQSVKQMIKQKQVFRCIFRCRLRASFTVEAALVMNIVLLTMVSMILYCFTLHDEVMAKNTLLEALECYTHRSSESGEESNRTETEASKKISQDETSYFRIVPSEIKISDAVTDLRVSAASSWNGESYEVYSPHLSIETLMRLAAVKDGLDDIKGKGETDGNENIRKGNP